MQEMGERIKELREGKGWTQVQLGVYAGVSHTTVSLAEAGQRTPNAETVVKLARALDVEPGELLAGVTPKKDHAPSLPEILEEERRDAALEDLPFEVLIELQKIYKDRLDAVARALVRKGPYTEAPLSAKQREQREQREQDALPGVDDVRGAEAG